MPNNHLFKTSEEYLQIMQFGSAVRNYSKAIDEKVCCKYHPLAVLIEDHAAGDEICSVCGLVVGDRVIDVRSEWRCFENDKVIGREVSRVGGAENLLLSDGGLTTYIGSSTNSSVRYSSKVNISVIDRHMLTASKEIMNLSTRLNLSDSIVERAKVLYKQVLNSNRIRVRSTEAKAAACLYIACRQEAVPRTFKEICSVCPVDKRTVGRCFQAVVSLLETNLSLVNADEFLGRFCGFLGLPIRVERMAVHISTKAVDLCLIGGRSPVSIAAASICVSSQLYKLGREPKEVSEVAGVVENTILRAYRVLRKNIEYLVPRGQIFEISITELSDL